MIDSGTKDAYWIGAQGYENKAFTWITGESFNYTNWNDGEPSRTGTGGEKEHWVELRKSYSKKWNDVKNTHKSNKGFIIEIELGDNDIVYNDNYNYNKYLLIDKNTTYTEAEKYCELLGGHLVTIGSSGENDFVNNILEYGNRKWYYIGAKKNK